MKKPDVPHLLHFRVSHYNEKVRWALDHKRWPHTRQALLPGYHIPLARWHSGQNQLPILILQGKPIAGSNHILAEIERLRPEHALFPADPAQHKRALDLQRHFDDKVAPDLRRLFWATYIDRPEDCARMATDGFSDNLRQLWRLSFPLMKPILRSNMGLHANDLRATRKRLRAHFDRLAREVGRKGFLVGDTFSVADLTAAAVMTALVRPPQFPYPLPTPWPDSLLELRESLSHHAATQWVLDIYKRHRPASCEIS